MHKRRITYNKYRDSDSRGTKGRRPTPTRTLTVPMKISNELRELLDLEKMPNERYNDTILRLLRERTQKIAEYRKKAEALEQELQYYITTRTK